MQRLAMALLFFVRCFDAKLYLGRCACHMRLLLSCCADESAAPGGKTSLVKPDLGVPALTPAPRALVDERKGDAAALTPTSG